ncbi:unnamed protein product [Lathyrus sativus]|nr:unnamed protein product [Lathyrus sativus]
MQEENDANNISQTQEPTKVSDFDEDSDVDSDELETPQGSEKKFVRDAIKTYATKRNDRKRIVIKCDNECPFHMRFNKRVVNQSWQLVSLTNDHTCHRTAKNKQSKNDWLAKKFISVLSITPEMRPKGLVAESLKKCGVKLSSTQAYRAKKIALELIQGVETEQYSNLRNHAEELRRSNLNSTMMIKCDVSDIGPIFERIYVCLKACKAAFAYTCRPLIGMDACFLKGEYGGQLMAAVGKDRNNQIYLIAYVMVEPETRDSWKWFLNLLLHDMNNLLEISYGFISYQQKGLVLAIVNLGPNV